ncbi:MAG TPA: bifunctional UDP-N-acetylglucosamine diphosphorylase/glucosamine-1-phosphate N-acetyltransferase GlmU [Acidimicrobiales bacterium]|jgi:bifunctional UDP-N-acetylglucosamine pyrophosphorylase/glucosamine-1-phosphate N-acetyltransferase|nr:bifunctional UDP-N-acetylglucosamine diphosphorylase/glucosamine-1-phosphate N-acetyltransferase GlmU [Acidimicrobiales bacterium]
MGISAIVLAAGQGTRMRSDRPKPIHVICGLPMVLHVLHALHGLGMDHTILVVGHEAEQVTKKVQDLAPSDLHVSFVEQAVQRGTGDAVLVGLTAIHVDDHEDDTVLVLPGDTPLLRHHTVAELVAAHHAGAHAATILTTRLADPTGYGRVVRGRNGRVAAIVEERDATLEQRAIDEINTGIYCFRRDLLGPALRRVTPANAQGEYYLTDVVAVLYDAGHPVDSVTVDDPAEVQGVNDRAQLATAEAELRRRITRRWLLAGVTMLDPERTYIDTTVELGRDVTLFPGTMLQGRTIVGRRVEIGPDTRLVDVTVGDGAVVSHSVAIDSEIGARAVVGPFAALPAGSSVAPGERTGPFYTGTREPGADDRLEG